MTIASDPRTHVALEFTTWCETADDIDALNSKFSAVVQPYGVTSFDATVLGPPNAPYQPRILAGVIDPVWREHYGAQGHVRRDPTVTMLQRETRPFSWHDLQQRYRDRGAQQVFSDARAAGYIEGLDIPWRTDDGLLGLITLRGERIDLSSTTKPLLRLVATYYAEIARELREISDEPSDSSPLSRRQRECLQWAARGKTDWEIGRILGIAEGTVRRHFERVRARLGVPTRIQAIVHALSEGWIRPSIGPIDTIVASD